MHKPSIITRNVEIRMYIMYSHSLSLFLSLSHTHTSAAQAYTGS